MKIKEELKQLRTKTIDELKVQVGQLRAETVNKRVQVFLGDQASAKGLQSLRKKIARALTLVTEKQHEEKKKNA